MMILRTCLVASMVNLISGCGSESTSQIKEGQSFEKPEIAPKTAPLSCHEEDHIGREYNLLLGCEAKYSDPNKKDGFRPNLCVWERADGEDFYYQYKYVIRNYKNVFSNEDYRPEEFDASEAYIMNIEDIEREVVGIPVRTINIDVSIDFNPESESFATGKMTYTRKGLEIGGSDGILVDKRVEFDLTNCQKFY